MAGLEDPTKSADVEPFKDLVEIDRRRWTIGAAIVCLATAAECGFGAISEMGRLIEGVPEGKVLLELDGVEFVVDARAEELTKKAYAEAKQYIGGPHWIPDDRIEIHFENKGMVRVHQHEYIDGPAELLSAGFVLFLIGVNDGRWLGHRWPTMLEYFMLAGFRDCFPKGLELLDFDPELLKVSGNWHQIFGDPEDTVRSNLRMLVMSQLKVSKADRLKMIYRMHREGVSIIDMAAFMESFGVKHEIFEHGKPGEQTGIFVIRHEGKIKLLPIVYNRGATGKEQGVSYPFGLEFYDANGQMFFDDIWKVPRDSGYGFGSARTLDSFAPEVAEAVEVRIKGTDQKLKLQW